MTKTSIIRTTTTTTTTNNNGELSINDRLPSNNVSFQSAIICTIPEINSAFISLYQSNHQNYTNDNDDNDHTITSPATTTATTTTAIKWKDQMDIRVTGLVLYTDTKHEFIILGDALHQPTIVKRSTLFSHGRVMGVGRASNNSSSNTSNTSNNQTMTLSATPSSSSSILLGKKRKLITVKKNTHSSLLLKKNHTNLTYSNNKSPSSSSTTTTSSKSNEKNTTWKLDPIMIKIIEQKRKEGMKMIIIDFKSGMNDVVWKDDDLVMVIGNLSLLTRGSDNDNNNNGSGSGSDEDKNMLDDRECYIRSVLDLIYHGSSFGRGDQQNQSTCSIGFTNGSGFVTSRIITNVNGTDMNLFQEGLKKRREYLNRISIQ